MLQVRRRYWRIKNMSDGLIEEADYNDPCATKKD